MHAFCMQLWVHALHWGIPFDVYIIFGRRMHAVYNNIIVRGLDMLYFLSFFFILCTVFFQMWLTVYFILASDMILDSGNLSTETIGYSSVCTLQVSV